MVGTVMLSPQMLGSLGHPLGAGLVQQHRWRSGVSGNKPEMRGREGTTIAAEA